MKYAWKMRGDVEMLDVLLAHLVVRIFILQELLKLYSCLRRMNDEKLIM